MATTPSPNRRADDAVYEERDSDVDSDPESEEPEIFTPIEIEPAKREPVKIQVRGVTVLFPYDPYESQKEMIKHLVEAAEDGENCLLESPTGTGKTAALLCALLAWLEKYNKENYTKRSGNEEPQRSNSPSPRKKIRIEMEPEVPGNKPPFSSETFTSDESLFEDLPRPRLVYGTRTHSQIAQVVKQLKETAYSKTKMAIMASRNQCCINTRAKNPVRVGKDELLSVDEMCMKLRGINVDSEELPAAAGQQGVEVVEGGRRKKKEDLPLCEFYHSDKGEVEGFIDDFMKERDGTAFDIEEFMEAGRTGVHCPYYALKVMQKREDVDLILCTYNHIVDPWVRKAVGMDSLLKNSIVVFDEAHNIEGVCRDIFSKYISSHKIETIRIRLDEASMKQDIPLVKKEPLNTLQSVVKRLSDWFDKEERDPNGYVPESRNSRIYQKVFTKQLFGMLCSLGLDADELKTYWKAYYVMDDKSKEHGYDATAAKFKIHKTAMDYLRTVFGGFRLIHENCAANEADPTIPKDYIVLLEKEQARRFDPNQSVLRTHQNNVFQGSFHHLKLKIVCVNSAVSFKEATGSCRSIVAASGTLSPLESFSSELDTEFQHTDKLPHVVSKERIFPAILSRHLNHGFNLEFTTKQLSPRSSSSQGIVDDVGSMLVKLCGIVPNGFLVFFPSKSRMVPMVTRWNQTGILEQLMGIKPVFSEKVWKHEANADAGHTFPEGIIGANSEVDLTAMLVNFRETARSPNGALLFAVLRGRISEGIDFKDEEARGVMTIGIPYGPMNDIKIKEKKNYNDRMNKLNPNYLNGFKWYTAEAYRALNQALGRCIRHAKDWGLVFVVDSRISYRGRDNLPSWIVEHCRTRGSATLEDIEEAAVEFVKNAQEAWKEGEAE